MRPNEIRKLKCFLYFSALFLVSYPRCEGFSVAHLSHENQDQKVSEAFVTDASLLLCVSVFSFDVCDSGER